MGQGVSISGAVAHEPLRAARGSADTMGVMKQVVSAVLGGFVAATFCLLVIPCDEKQGLDASPIPASAVQTWTVPAQNEIHELTERMGVLEARVAAAVESQARAPAFSAGRGNDGTEVNSRLAALEGELADLRQHFSMIALEPEAAGEGDSDRRGILMAFNGGPGCEVVLSAMGRVPFGVRYLEQWPDSSDARNVLIHLIMDYRRTAQPRKAMTAVERYGPKMNLSAAELDELRLSAAFDPADQVEIARRVLLASSDPNRRAEALCALAKGLAGLGRSEEALATTKTALGQFAGTSNMGGWVYQMEHLRANLLSGR